MKSKRVYIEVVFSEAKSKEIKFAVVLVVFLSLFKGVTVNKVLTVQFHHLAWCQSKPTPD